MKIRFVLLGYLPPVALALALLLGCDGSELCRGEACAAANARNQTATCSAGDCVDGGDVRNNDASVQDGGRVSAGDAGSANSRRPDAARVDAQVPDSCPSEAGICLQDAGDCGCDASTPVCSESSSLDENHCVVCLEDSHCPAEAPHCTDSGCVACRAGGTDCGPESPVCAESTCSACSNHDDCARFEETPVCDSASGSCAECLTDEHCTVAGASRCVENQCVPCDVDADCAHLPSQHLCHEGLCVECYGKETSACETNRVCNMIAGSEAPYSCTHFRAGEADLCKPCVSDAHCRAGAHCVLTQFQGQDTGYFCLLREGGDAEDSPADCRTAQLYTNAQELTSTEGRTGRYCAPERTTCQALLDYSDACEVDDDCGMPGLDDGLCVPYSETTYRCSYSCTQNVQCRPSSECELNKYYCSL